MWIRVPYAVCWSAAPQTYHPASNLVGKRHEVHVFQFSQIHVKLVQLWVTVHCVQGRGAHACASL